MKVAHCWSFVKRFLLTLSLVLWLSGCTTQSWYEGFKMGAESECYKQPPGATADCLGRLNKKSHEEFEKERSSK